MRLRATRLGVASGGAEMPLPRRVRNILSKYDATLLIPGAGGVAVQTFSPGNYVESTGQTLTPVDGAVGRVVDAAGVPGVELVTNGTFDSTDGWALAANGTATAPVISGGVVSFNSQSTDYVWCRRNLAAALTVGKTYEVSVECKTFASGNFQLVLLGGTNTIPIAGITGVGSRRAIFTATAAHTAVEISRTFGSSSYVASFDNLTVRELPGIHATQPATQNTPVLRRGLVNLQTYSTPTTGQWVLSQSGTGVTPVVTYGYTTAPNGQPAARVQLERGAGTTISDFSQFHAPTVTVVSGLVHSAALWMRTTDGVSTIQVSLRDGVGYTTVQVTGQWQLFIRSATTASSIMAVGCRVRGTEGTDQTADILVASAGIFQGTVTAEQIIDAGGIPVTTSAPASSALGPQYWKFDGTDDRLRLSSVPFQMDDDHWVVVGHSPAKLQATAFCPARKSNTYRIATVSTSSGGNHITEWWDGSTYVNHQTPCQLNQPVIITAIAVGQSCRSRKDGIQFGISAKFLTVQPAGVVGGISENVLGPFNGKIHAVIFGKGAISDSELLTLERFAAKLQGRTL